MIINVLLIACAVGVFQHFVYDALGQPRLLAPFLPVGESVWEHFKLVFYPLCGALIYIGNFAGASRDAILFACFVSAVHSMLVMFGLFYLYFSGLGIKKPRLYFDIPIFFLSMISGFYLGLWCLALNPSPIIGGFSSFMLAVILVCLVIFSYKPPKLPLFTEY